MHVERIVIAAAAAVVAVAAQPALAVGEFCQPFRVAYQATPGSAVDKWMQKLRDVTTENVDPQAEYRLYPAGQLVRSAEVVPALQRGVANIGVVRTSQLAEAFPALAALELPGLVTDTQAMKEIYSGGDFISLANKALADAGLRLLAVGVSPKALISAKDQLASFKDLSGHKIRASSLMEDEMIAAAGGVPVQVAFAEIFPALERGAFDGAVTYLDAVRPFKLDEVTRSVLISPLLTDSVVLLASQEFLKRARPEVVEDFAKAAARTSLEFTLGQEQTAESEVAAFRKAGLRVTSVTAEDAANDMNLVLSKLWSSLAKGVGEDAMAALEALQSDLTR